MRTLARRLWNSPTFTTWGSLTVRLSGVVIVLPMLLTRFAAPEVAVWQLFATLFTLTLMFDFGLSPTFARLLAFARGGASLQMMANMRQIPIKTPADAGNSQTAARVFSTLMWLYPRLGSVIVLLLAVLGTLALQHPISQLADPTMAWIAWAVVLASSLFGFVGNAYAAALQGMDSIAPLRRWEVATGLAQIISTLLVLAAHGGLLAIVVTYQCWVVFNCFRNRRLLKSLHPQLLGQAPGRDIEVLKIMWPATWRSGVGVLMSQGIIQSSGLVYSQLAPATEVASYLLGLRVITTISQFSQAPFYSKLPRLAELQASGQRDQQIAIARKGMLLAHWIFVVGVLAAAALAGPLLMLIGSHTPFVSTTVWALLGFAFFVERFGAMHLQLYSLTNHIIWHIANGVTGLIMITTAWLLYPAMHEVAFPIAMLIAYAGFYAIYAVKHSMRALGIRILTFESRTSLAPACVLALGLGAALLLAAKLNPI